MVLVIDRSGSMGAELAAVQAGATYFVNQFAAGRDKLGLVLISGSAFVAYPPADLGKTPTTPPTTAIGPDVNFNGTSETPNMITTIANMKSGSNTGTAEGLMLAYHELQAANEPGALNIIVLWTDGAPNGITADFNNSSHRLPLGWKWVQEPERRHQWTLSNRSCGQLDAWAGSRSGAAMPITATPPMEFANGRKPIPAECP